MAMLSRWLLRQCKIFANAIQFVKNLLCKKFTLYSIFFAMLVSLLILKCLYYRVFLLLSVCFRVIICDRICEKGPHAMIIVFVEIGDKH